MASGHGKHLKQKILACLQLLENHKENFSAEEERRLSQVIEKLIATLDELKGIPLQPYNLGPETSSPPTSPIPSVENIFQLLPDGHLITSCQGTIHMANHQIGQLFQNDYGGLIGVSLSEFISGSDWEVILDHLNKISGGGRHWEGMVRITPGDQPASLVSCRVSGLRDRQGNVFGLHWLIQDFREQQRVNVAEELVQAIGEQVLVGLTLDQTVWLVCRRIVESFHYPLIWIGTKETDGTIKIRGFGGEWSHLMGNYQENWKGSPEKRGAAARAIEHNATQVFKRDDSPPSWPGDWPWGDGVQSGAALPLAVRNQVLGVLTVFAHPGQTFEPGVIQWLERLAGQISLGLFLARDYDYLRLQGVAVNSAEHAVCITNPQGCIEWVNEAYCRLTGYKVKEVIGTLLPSFPTEEAGIRLAQSKPPLPQGRFWRQESVKKRKDGSVYTVEEMLTPLLDERGLVTNFVSVLQDITARKEAEAQMVYRAQHDPLTDLPNRVMFQDRLNQALAWARRHGRLVSVMFLDLDGFKQINDEFGHGAGDKILQTVARRLNQCVRATDTVARMSGDEFTVILQDVERVQDVFRVAQKILNRLGQLISIDGSKLSARTSLGIALYPLDGTEPEVLLQRADQAMYKAKGQGGQCCRFASEDLNLQFAQIPVGKSGSSLH